MNEAPPARLVVYWRDDDVGFESGHALSPDESATMPFAEMKGWRRAEYALTSEGPEVNQALPLGQRILRFAFFRHRNESRTGVPR